MLDTPQRIYELNFGGERLWVGTQCEQCGRFVRIDSMVATFAGYRFVAGDFEAEYVKEVAAECSRCGATTVPCMGYAD